MSHLQTKTTTGHDLLYDMFDVLLNRIDDMCNVTVCSVLNVIAKVKNNHNYSCFESLLKFFNAILCAVFCAQTVREVSANLPLELVQKLLSPESHVIKLRFSPSKSVQTATLKLYHALLNLKNIPLLQEAYK